MQYNTIPQAGTFGNAVQKMNDNFGLTSDAIEQLRHDVSKSKGLYASAAALAAAIPSPQVGDWALVQGTNTIAIYVEDDGEWVDSGETWSGGDVPLDEYVEKSDFDTLSNAAVTSSSVAGQDLVVAGYNVVVLTAAQYAALTNKDNNTLYFVTP